MPNTASQYPFLPRDFELEEVYRLGFGVQELMPVAGNGIVTKRDRLNVHPSASDVNKMLDDFEALNEHELRHKYGLPEDVRDWRYEWALSDINNNRSVAKIAEIQYRPFDHRFVFYSGRARGLLGWPVAYLMKHYLNGRNIGLVTSKAFRDAEFGHVMATQNPTEAIFLSGTTGSNAMNLPLFLYPDGNDLDQSIRVNMDPSLRRKIEAAAMGLDQAPKGDVPIELNAAGEPVIEPRYGGDGRPNEVAIFDYIYGVLHSPDYRKTFADFLKIDFPRIPLPASPELFRHMQEKGTQLRRLHLMDEAVIGDTPYSLVGEGDSVVGKVRYEGGHVWINDRQCFKDVPEVAWSFFIGGYQPAHKWLKDRRGRAPLGFKDTLHYQKIIKILTETDRIMREIDLPTEAAAAS